MALSGAPGGSKAGFIAFECPEDRGTRSGEQPGEAVTAAMFQTMRDALAEQQQTPLSIDDTTAMIAEQIGQITPMNEETAELFQKLAKKMLE